MDEKPAFEIRALHKEFPVARSVWAILTGQPRPQVRAVDGVSLSLQRGEIVGLVGESGSGKTTVGMNVLGLQQPTSGQILINGYDATEWARGHGASLDAMLNTPLPGQGRSLATMSRRARVLELRRRAQMIFQDPYEALNPRQKIFDIMAEPLRIHDLARAGDDMRSQVRVAMETCGLTPAENYWDRYPGALSGGQRQRVVIAGALILKPLLLVADEPVSMLDVSIRADILNLLRELRDKHGIAILYITHDLATAAYFTDRIAVMYLGRIVEIGPTQDVLSSPRHPYAQALLSVVPAPNPRRRRKRVILSGETPNAAHLPPGCRFHPRCPVAFDRCRLIEPDLEAVATGHSAACLLIDNPRPSEG
jgi:peptide/nickel transport system ATP-binding protein